MPLKVVHDLIDEIPEQYRELYTVEDGKARLTGIVGVKTDADIMRLQTALSKERDEHKAARALVKQFEPFGTAEELAAKLDRMTELEVAARGKVEEMDKRLEELAEARARTRLAPVERENKTLKEQLGTTAKELEQLQAERTRRQVTDAVRAAATAAKIRPEALDDVLLLGTAVCAVTEDGKVLTQENAFGIPSGLSAEVWLQEMTDRRPHWWPESTGGGARGSGPGGTGGGTNPWSNEGWNLTEQGRVLREHGEERATQMARAAGTTLGGPRPAARK